MSDSRENKPAEAPEAFQADQQDIELNETELDDVSGGSLSIPRADDGRYYAM